MLYATTKLRRLKCLRMMTSIVTFPFRLPLFVLHIIGNSAIFIDRLVFQASYSSIERYIVKKCSLDDVALKQIKNNPNKFK